MKATSIRSLVLASLASLAMATPSSAITILQYGQTNPNDVKTATASGSNTTITTSSLLSPTSIPVTITNIGGNILPPALSIAAWETWTNVTSTGPATTSGNTISQPFQGTLAYTALAGGLGTNYLTVTFTGGILTGIAGGGSASLIGSDPPGSVTYTTNDPRVEAALTALGTPFLENFSVAFSGIGQPPGFSLSGNTIAGFTARNAGTFDANPVPEPSGLAMAGTAMLASLGCFGWRRRQSSRA
jgi:hypothetical protein